MKTKFLFLFLLLSKTIHSGSSNNSCQYFNCYYTGIDISHYQGDIKWSEIDSTLDFIIVKASEGESLVDCKFEKNWNSIKCLKGAYHFFRPQYSGEKQANLFLNVVNFKPGDIKPIIDVEYSRYWKDTLNIKKYIDNLVCFISVIKERTGVMPIIYTNPLFWSKYIENHYHFDHILWVADWRDREEPEIPSKFNDWTLWQYSDKGTVKGIKGPVDLNYCKDLDTLLIK